MKTKLITAVLACAVAFTTTTTQAQTPATESVQVPIPKTAAEVPGPPPGTAMTKEYVQMVGRMAYLWGYPLVNAHNRRVAFSKAPEPILIDGILPFAPVGYNAMLTSYVSPKQTFIVCANQDVVYGGGFTALDKEPMVLQVPDFGKRFWVYALYDHRSDEIARIGQQYGTKPGFYMIVGQDWKGEAPAGINAVVRSSTDLVFTIPRIFKDDTAEDTKAVQPLIDQVVFYPLSKFDGKMKTVDWSKLPHVPAPPEQGKGESGWVKPDIYYEELPVVMKEVPPLPGEEALYGWISSVWEAAAKDPATKEALVASFVAAEKELVDPLSQWKLNGRSAGNGWNSPVNNARWGTDYLNRTGTSKSNMYDNVPEETKYIYRDDDSAGQQLDGKNSYTVTFPKGQEPPVKGFWSLTLYNAEHFFHLNELKRSSLGTKSKSFMKNNADGSLTLYFGAKSPGKDKESNWLPAPEGTFSLYIRCYWPEKAVLDGTWKPPQVEKVK